MDIPTVEPVYQQDETPQALPLLFAFFAEGLHVTAAAPGHEDLLWARILKFDDAPVERIYKALDEVVAQDNSMRLLAKAPEFMRFPQLLKALGLVKDSSKVNLTIVDRHGQERVVSSAIASGKQSNWLRRPVDTKGELPLFVVNRKDLYWFKYFPESKTVYFQYNGCVNKKEESIGQFAARLFSFIEQNDVGKLVVDLRWNGGGNMFVNKPLLEGLIGAKKVNRPGHLFVIAGRYTFSAAMIFTEQVERYTHAIFVGEPTGSSPNFVGETNFVQLPYSKMLVSLSNLYWQNSTAMDHRTWIAPRIYDPPTFASWRNGLDPALEAILAYQE